MIRRLIGLLVSLVVGVACTPHIVTKGSHIRLIKSPKTISTTGASEVIVFYRSQPDFDYLEVGIVEAMAIGSQAGLQDLIPELQIQAAAIGASAIHKIEIQRHNQAGDTLHATAVAIIKKPLNP